MIKKLINKLLGKSATADASSVSMHGKKLSLGKREEVGVASHGIDPSLVDERAIHVVRTSHPVSGRFGA